MKITIPVSAHDKHLLPDLTACLLKMGGLEEHPVILFPTPSAKETAFEAAEKLDAQTHVLEQDFEGGAPIACNNHFAAVVYALARMGNTDPFLWMEADMLPTAPRWPDPLQNEYRMLGQPFMGNIVDTPFEVDGKLVYREGDQMMMGCGVYPAHMESDERIKPLIADLAKTGARNPRVPFDVYLRWVTKTIGRADTKLICDMWGTENYEREDYEKGILGRIHCQSVDHGDRVVRERCGLIPTQALLVHGCKDGSLARLVLGKPDGKQLAVDLDQVGCRGNVGPIGVAGSKERKVGFNPALGAPYGTPESTSSGIAHVPSESDGDDGFWGDESTPAPIPVTAPTPKQHTVTEYVPPVVKTIPDAVKKKEPAPAPAPEGAKAITRADIEAAMDGKKMRLNELAKKLKVDVPYLAGTFSRNGYEVLTAGWVRSTIQITKD
jgi:hypothetical protein